MTTFASGSETARASPPPSCPSRRAARVTGASESSIRRRGRGFMRGTARQRSAARTWRWRQGARWRGRRPGGRRPLVGITTIGGPRDGDDEGFRSTDDRGSQDRMDFGWPRAGRLPLRSVDRFVVAREHDERPTTSYGSNTAMPWRGQPSTAKSSPPTKTVSPSVASTYTSLSSRGAQAVAVPVLGSSAAMLTRA